jgi:tetratricopeptide (TPR) repeat protein
MCDLWESGKHVQALKAFEEKVEANPSDRSCLCNLAWAQLELEMYRGCIKSCDKALAADGSNTRAFLVKGAAQQKMGKLKKAKATWLAGLKSAQAARTDVSDFCQLKRYLKEVEVGNSEPTKPMRTETVVTSIPCQTVPSSNASPKNSVNWELIKVLLQKAESWSTKKMNKTACGMWQQVIGMQPSEEIVFVCQLRIGKLWLSNEKWSLACTHLQKASRLGSPAQKAMGLFLLAHAQLGQQLHAAAKSSLDDALVEISGSSGTVTCSGTVTWDQAALGAFCTEQTKSAHDVLALQARVHRLSGQMGLAVALSQQVVREDETHREALIELALLSEESGQHGQVPYTILHTL